MYEATVVGRISSWQRWVKTRQAGDIHEIAKVERAAGVLPASRWRVRWPGASQSGWRTPASRKTQAARAGHHSLLAFPDDRSAARGAALSTQVALDPHCERARCHGFRLKRTLWKVGLLHLLGMNKVAHVTERVGQVDRPPHTAHLSPDSHQVH